MTTDPSYAALVLGASGGIGEALVAALAADPACADAVGLSRRRDGVDLLDEGTLARAAGAHQRPGGYDLIINAAGALEIDGAPPEKSFRAIDPAVMTRAFQINAVGAALAFKHFAPLLRRDARAVFATLSARVGSIGDNRLGGWMSYRASKAALNQIVRCAAIEERRRNDAAVVIALHPGTIETAMTKAYANGRFTATPAQAAQHLLAVCAEKTPQDTGGFFDYRGAAIAW